MRKSTEQHIKKGIVLAMLVGLIVLAVFYSARNPEPNPSGDQVPGLSGLTAEELSFLKQEGFLQAQPQGKEELSYSNLKPPGLIEQGLDTPDEYFEVLATKLDLSQNSYQLAFKLENKSNQEKEFYLIPVSEQSQTEFKEIKGNLKELSSFSETDEKELSSLYNVEKHKQELKPELAQAYQDIDNNNYQAKPVKLVLPAKSTLLAQSKWQIKQIPNSQFPIPDSNLKPVYFLVYGSAGGVKDDLTILNVHSHPQQGDNWEVSFTTRGKGDLKIIPNDQATINDDEFVSLFCNNEKRNPQLLPGDVIYYPDWQCSGIGKVVHYTKKAGEHTLKFEFSDQADFAYNDPDPVIVTFQQGVQPDAGYTGCQDTRLSAGSNADKNYGITMFIVSLTPTTNNGLISFDVSSIPSNAVVTDAELYIKAFSGGSEGIVVAAYQGMVPWIEGTKNGATAAAGEPCWNWRQYDTVAWGVAGGLAGTDYNAAAEGSVVVAADNVWYHIHIPVMVAAWVANSGVNYGAWLLRTDVYTGSGLNLYSSEHSTTANRPYLTVTYTEAGGGGPAVRIKGDFRIKGGMRIK